MIYDNDNVIVIAGGHVSIDHQNRSRRIDVRQIQGVLVWGIGAGGEPESDSGQ